MRRLVLLEWKKLRRPIIISIFICISMAAMLTGTIYKSYSLEAQLEVFEVGFSIFNIIFPIIAVVPTCWLLYIERKNGYLNYTLPRVSKRNYLFAKWIVVSGSAFAVMFITCIASVIVSLYIVPPIDVVYSLIDPTTGETISRMQQTHIAATLFTDQPLLYGLFLSLWKGLLGAIMATMGFVFSLYSKNLFVILTGPFVYFILENFTLSVFGLEAYRLVTAFEPTLISNEKITVLSYVAGPITVIIVCAIYIAYKRIFSKDTVYQF